MTRIDAEAGRVFLWAPVCFGVGIAFYFALAWEPGWGLTGGLLLAGFAVFFLSQRSYLTRLVTLACLLMALGFANAKWRCFWVAAPVVTKQTKPLWTQGWIESLARRADGALRLTLRPTTLGRWDKTRIPHRIRVIWRGRSDPVSPGDFVALRVVLRPPPAPVLPGGFDFARQAWFQRLGAVGYAVSPPRKVTPAPALSGLAWWQHEREVWRHRVAARIHAVLPGQAGAFAAALLTGERAAIAPESQEALRKSGLAHLLAISGMHMGVMAGSLFWVLRFVLALFPPIALRFPVRKWAAALALVGAGAYLLLSGASLATQRAFIMIAVFFLAVLLDRPALTLRNVALAAGIILILFPESLLSVSFQMSFAAATALVAVYEALWHRRGDGQWVGVWAWLFRRLGITVSGILLTTLVASLAVAPFAAFHFHRLANYSLVANLAAMPIFSLLVMPMALASLLLMPLDWDALPLSLMAWGTEAILAVARYVSAWPGAMTVTGQLPSLSLGLLVGGGLWLCLWRTLWRWLGVVPIALGLLVPAFAQKPDLLVGRQGGVVAVYDPGKGLSVTTHNKIPYEVGVWRRALGLAEEEPWKIQEKGRNPADETNTSGFRCDSLGCVATKDGHVIAWARHPAALFLDCQRADLLVTTLSLGRRKAHCPAPKRIIDKREVWRKGAHALFLKSDGTWEIVTVAQKRGKRPWVLTGQNGKK